MMLAFLVLKPDASHQWLAVRRTNAYICQTYIHTPDTMASRPFLQNPAKSWEKSTVHDVFAFVQFVLFLLLPY